MNWLQRIALFIALLAWKKIPIKYAENGNMILPKGAPFDGKPVLLKMHTGVVEARWIPSEPTIDHEGNHDDRGFCWYIEWDDSIAMIDDPIAWMPLL